jgi:hypothetical protein
MIQASNNYVTYVFKALRNAAGRIIEAVTLRCIGLANEGALLNIYNGLISGHPRRCLPDSFHPNANCN